MFAKYFVAVKENLGNAYNYKAEIAGKCELHVNYCN